MKCTNCGNDFEGDTGCPLCGTPATQTYYDASDDAPPQVWQGTYPPEAPQAAPQYPQPPHPHPGYGQYNPAAGHPQGQPGQPYGQPGYGQPQIVINNMGPMGSPPESPKSRTAALLLAIFVGVLGVHAFYAGKVGMGILYLFTGGLCGIGALVDIIRIATGSYKDGNGLPITKW